jgi:trimeric autotransporter adhesin
MAVFTGNSGNNTLQGGLGDTLIGQVGDDIYGAYDTSTVIVENPGEGTDTVWTSANYTLSNNLENGYAVGNISLTGNTEANSLIAYGNGNISLYGLGGNDVLNSAGASGTTVMRGGLGDDIYGRYGTQDQIIESAGEGYDTVWTAANYNVDANIEKAIAVGNITINAATSSISLQSYGDGLQQLNGNSGNDTLDSNGALGSSTMAGGAGDDVYGYYNSSTDVIIENASEGHDTVWAADNYTLTANLEDAYLVGDIAVTGNDQANLIVGYGTGKQVIDGGIGDDTIAGGLGADTMIGGAGADTFKFLFGDSSYLAYDSVNDFDRTLTTDQVFIGAGIASVLSTANVVQAFVGIGTPADIKSSLDQIYSGIPAPGVPSFAYSNLAAAHTKVTTVGAPSGVLFGVANPTTGAANYWALVEDGDGILTTNDIVVNITQSSLPLA